jgi:hypothetical protein
MTRQLYVATRNNLYMTVGYISSAWPGLSDGLMVARRSLRAHVRFQCAQTRRQNAKASNTNIDARICTCIPVLSVLDVPKLVWPVRIRANATVQLCLHCTQVMARKLEFTGTAWSTANCGQYIQHHRSCDIVSTYACEHFMKHWLHAGWPSHLSRHKHHHQALKFYCNS